MGSKDTLIRKGVTPGTTYEIYQGKTLYISIQRTELKKVVSTETVRGTIEEKSIKIVPIQEKDERPKKYQGRINYAKRLQKDNGGKIPKNKIPEGWKLEEIEVIEKRKGLIENKVSNFQTVEVGKKITQDIFIVPLSSQINKLVANILNSK